MRATERIDKFSNKHQDRMMVCGWVNCYKVELPSFLYGKPEENLVVLLMRSHECNILRCPFPRICCLAFFNEIFDF